LEAWCEIYFTLTLIIRLWKGILRSHSQARNENHKAYKDLKKQLLVDYPHS